jgi:hypothetical protein
MTVKTRALAALSMVKSLMAKSIIQGGITEVETAVQELLGQHPLPLQESACN